MQRCSLNEILKSANLLPFEQQHIQFLLSLVKKQYAKGLVVRFHPLFSDSPQEAVAKMQDGIFVLTCPQIQSDFVFTCENGGKGLFGGQKRVFKVFIGDLELDDFTAANTFKSFGIAATSVNNIFRNEGLLSGAV
ncbi:hypothetical protein [Aliiroseovarius sp. YM-037]|uniref:hypothetical protein n=1 Tax=Aliiroseovarius sp. YM-037 TaxID=3341728 RepID=UPI003A808357